MSRDVRSPILRPTPTPTYMDITLTTWLVLPAIGGVIGYATNWLAVKMLFRPIKPVNLLGLRLQGLMPRRQQDMARNIGEVVGVHLLRHEDVVQALGRLDLQAMLSQMLDTGLAPQITALRDLPLIGGFLTDDRIGEIRKSIADGILKEKDQILAKLEDALENELDVRALVTQKVAAFPIEQLESLVIKVASRELKAIEILGGVLGIILGLCQVGLLYFLA